MEDYRVKIGEVNDYSDYQRIHIQTDLSNGEYHDFIQIMSGLFPSIEVRIIQKVISPVDVEYYIDIGDIKNSIKLIKECELPNLIEKFDKRILLFTNLRSSVRLLEICDIVMQFNKEERRIIVNKDRFGKSNRDVFQFDFFQTLINNKIEKILN